MTTKEHYGHKIKKVKPEKEANKTLPNSCKWTLQQNQEMYVQHEL